MAKIKLTKQEKTVMIHDVLRTMNWKGARMEWRHWFKRGKKKVTYVHVIAKIRLEKIIDAIEFEEDKNKK